MVNRVVRLELFDNVNREESFNDLLISIGYAEKWEESPQSRINHDARRKAQLTRDESVGQLRLEILGRKGVYDPEDIVEVCPLYSTISFLIPISRNSSVL